MSTEHSEAVKHVEAVHVDDCSVDAELCYLETLSQLLDEGSCLLSVVLLSFRQHVTLPAGSVGQSFLREIPLTASRDWGHILCHDIIGI